jgi:hypothetical protein
MNLAGTEQEMGGRMKKVVLSLMVMGFFVGGTFSSALAQERKVSFSLNVGIQTNLTSESPFENLWFSLDTRFGIAIGKSLEISPEVMAAAYDDFSFDEIYLYPGVMLNYKLGNFFIGAGAVLPIIFYIGEVDSYNPAPKVNFGYRRGNLILTVYIFTWIMEDFGFLEYNQIGATVGFTY